MQKEEYIIVVGYGPLPLVFFPSTGRFYDLAFVEVVDDEGTKIYASRTKLPCFHGKSCNLGSGPHYPFSSSQCLFLLEVNILSSLPLFGNKVSRLYMPVFL